MLCVVSAPAIAAPTQAQVQAAIDAAVDSKDRPAADHDMDAARRPKQMMAFMGIQPGMKVLDVIAGRGWYTELEARVVGPGGEVYMFNTPSFIQRVSDAPMLARVANGRLPNIKRWEKPLEAMDLPSNHFDGVIINDDFHDLFWLTADVPAVVKQIYDSLKPGGFFAVIDHSAPPGTGDSFARDQKGPHRIDEEFVNDMVRKGGFKLVAKSDALRNPADDRTKSIIAPEMKGIDTDKFALLFKKPD
jgi:predicted methyltransferase